MRVPLYPADLESQSGFKRLAKNLKRNWPGNPPISLSQSYEVLAKGLGYRNYHDVRQSIHVAPFKFLELSQSEVLLNLAEAVRKAISHDEADGYEPINVESALSSLPLNVLTALRHLSDAKPSPEALSAPSPTFTEPKRRRVGFLEREKGNEGNVAWPDKIKLVTPDEILAIKKALEKSGDLRHLALFSLVMCGVRLSEVERSLVIEGGVKIPVSLKTSRARYRNLMSPDVSAYTRAGCLQPGSYLFPSKRDQNLPVPAHLICRLVSTWGPMAGLNRQITYSALRATAVIPETMARLHTLLGLK